MSTLPGAAQFDDPGVSDVHVPGPINSQKPRKSPMLKRLMKGLRGKASRGYVTAEEIETEYRTALGHAGAAGKAAKRASAPMPCQGCESGNPASCQCPQCVADQPQQCICCAILHGKRAAEPADAKVCAAHMAGNPDACTCSSCQAGDPDDCICDSILEEQAGHRGESQTDTPERVPAGPGGYNPKKGSDARITSSTGESFRLFMEAPQAFVTPPPTINVLPKPGTYTHPEYGTITITPERNANFVRNFKAGVYQTRVPIDAEHQTKVSGALGWITDTAQNPDGSVDAQVEWTDRGVTMLASDRFRYISPEWYDGWTAPDTGDEHTDVLIGAALCTRPFFKEGALRSLVATETGIRVGDDPRVFSPLPGQGTLSPRPNGQEQHMTDSIQLTEDEIKRFREMESENKKLRRASDEAEEQSKKLRKAAEAAQDEAKRAAERVTALEVENRRRRFAEQAKTWQGDVTSHVSFMEALPTDELRQQYAEQQAASATALAEALTQAKAFTRVGVTGGVESDSAIGRLEAKAREIMATEPKKSHAVAFAEAVRANPDLYTEYVEATRGSVIEPN